MPKTKTKPTPVDPAAFIAAVDHPRRRRDAEAVDALLREVTGEAPRMWGPSIVGYGAYGYTYESGHSGESCRIGFSPRKANLVLYIPTGLADREAMVARLGPVKTGASCIYVTDLAKLDAGALRALCEAGWAQRAEAETA